MQTESIELIKISVQWTVNDNFSHCFCMASRISQEREGHPTQKLFTIPPLDLLLDPPMTVPSIETHIDANNLD